MQGFHDAQTATSTSAAYNPTYREQQRGYNGAMAGYADGENGNGVSNNSGVTPAYDAAYALAYQDGKAKASLGAADANGNTPAQNIANYNARQLDAYHAGQTNANNAYAKAKSNVTISNPYASGTDAYDTFNGAQAGFITGFTGNGSIPSGSNLVYTSAYNKALAEAKQNVTIGINDFAQNNDDSGKSNAVDATNQAIYNGYNQASDGYTSQLNGTVDTNNNNSAYKTGIQMAIDEQNGLNAAITNANQHLLVVHHLSQHFMPL